MNWYFGEGMETNSESEQVKKERNDKIYGGSGQYYQGAE